jgi:hypothetical protein
VATGLLMVVTLEEGVVVLEVVLIALEAGLAEA